MENLNVNRIHIIWEGPYSVADLKDDQNKGLYAIFGHHPASGVNSLLYIGKTVEQDINTRISQHNLRYRENSNSLRIIKGKFQNISSKKMLDLSTVTLAEKLMIYSHQPNWNSEYISSFSTDEIKDIQIFNWGNYLGLLPEVSGDRWSDKYWNENEYSFKDSF